MDDDGNVEENRKQKHCNKGQKLMNDEKSSDRNGAKGSEDMRMIVRNPLAPVDPNQAVHEKVGSSSMSNNNNDDDIENTLLATSEDFFTYRRDRPIFIPAVDHFGRLSDEMVLHIFKWLPKKTLIRCCFVSSRFNKIVHTDILWTRLDLGDKNLKSGALGNIISRGVVILRLASTDIHEPIFDEEMSHINWHKYKSKLQFLDLSMCTITTNSLKIFLSKCRKLKKLSLEHVNVNDEICAEIAANTDIDSLNMTMCEGITAIGLHVMAVKLQNIRCLNISWTNLSDSALEIFVRNITPDLLRLNVAGCRNTMTDQLLSELIERCPALVELDISDCLKMTTDGLKILAKLKSLEYLSISRCYSVDVPTFL